MTRAQIYPTRQVPTHLINEEPRGRIPSLMLYKPCKQSFINYHSLPYTISWFCCLDGTRDGTPAERTHKATCLLACELSRVHLWSRMVVCSHGTSKVGSYLWSRVSGAITGPAVLDSHFLPSPFALKVSGILFVATVLRASQLWSPVIFSEGSVWGRGPRCEWYRIPGS